MIFPSHSHNSLVKCYNNLISIWINKVFSNWNEFKNCILFVFIVVKSYCCEENLPFILISNKFFERLIQIKEIVHSDSPGALMQNKQTL